MSEVDHFFATQLRPHGVSKAMVEWLASVPLVQCLVEADQPFAYSDQGLPLGQDRFGLHPFEIAFALRALAPRGDESVLEVGHSSGYLTGLLAKTCCSVLCIEPSIEQATRIQKQVLEPLGIKNAQVREGNAYHGWGEEPFGIIVINGAVRFVPQILKDQLTIGGRLFAVVGQWPIMQAVLITRASQARFDSVVLFDACISDYVHLPHASGFSF